MKNTKKVVLLGPPGSGKSTVGEEVCSKFELFDLYMGNILREEIAKDTTIGRELAKYLKEGRLVPDDFISNLVFLIIRDKTHVLLDGFPRTMRQARFVEIEGVTFDTVILLDVNEEEVIKRLSNRRFCPNCRAQYHLIFIKPKVEGKCDKCQGELIQRSDDNPEVIQQRFREYYEKTAPLIEFYERKRILRRVDANPAPEIVIANTIKALEEEFERNKNYDW